MYTKIINVTPEKAEEFLLHNTNNRHIRKEAVESYARDMAAGKWALTGQGISFDSKGMLRDGQHRLMAVVKSGCTIPMLICFDIDDTTAIDCGVNRSLKDQIFKGGGMLRARFQTLR